MLTWKHPADAGASSIWLQPAIPLRFVFDDADFGALEREYLQTLARAANSSGGLVLEWQEALAPLHRAREVVAA